VRSFEIELGIAALVFVAGWLWEIYGRWRQVAKLNNQTDELHKRLQAGMAALREAQAANERLQLLVPQRTPRLVRAARRSHAEGATSHVKLGADTCRPYLMVRVRGTIIGPFGLN
jgi:23S rRNA maturation mini-RNase III